MWRVDVISGVWRLSIGVRYTLEDAWELAREHGGFVVEVSP